MRENWCAVVAGNLEETGDHVFVCGLHGMCTGASNNHWTHRSHRHAQARPNQAIYLEYYLYPGYYRVSARRALPQQNTQFHWPEVPAPPTFVTWSFERSCNEARGADRGAMPNTGIRM